MKLATIRNLRALLMSRQFTFTGDQLPAVVGAVQELELAEREAIRRESAPPVTLGESGGHLPIQDHTPDESYVEHLSVPK